MKYFFISLGNLKTKNSLSKQSHLKFPGRKAKLALFLANNLEYPTGKKIKLELTRESFKFDNDFHGVLFINSNNKLFNKWNAKKIIHTPR